MSRGLSRCLVMAGSLALAIACAEEPPPTPPPARPIKILEVGAGGSDTREYPGTIKAADESELSFEVPGRILELDVIEGQWYDEGTVLGKLDARDYKARLDSAAARRNNTKVNYERAESLYQQGVTAKAERDRREAAFEVAEAEWREAKKAFEDTVMVAPFDGRVARKVVEQFENVLAKQTVILFQDDQNLEIRVAIPERDFTRGRRDGPRNEVEADERLDPYVVVTSIPDRSFPADIKEIATAADPMTRTFEAKLTFDAPQDLTIMPGMTAKVTVKVPSASNEIRLPTTAVLGSDTGEPFVWVVDSQAMTVSPRVVTLGPLSGEELILTGGLENGDQVAISGVQQLRDGMAVRRYER